VVGGRYHDVNRVRLDLLTLLAEQDDAYVRVAESFEVGTALEDVSCLITYTCDVRPSAEAVRGLESFLARGGRWFALHGTNAFIAFDTWTGPVHGDVTIPGRYYAPDVSPELSRLLGSRFLAHPTVQPFQVSVTQPEHPLVAGLSEFTVTDEAYCCEFLSEVEVLLHTVTSGAVMRRVPESIDDPDQQRPLLYLRRHDAGAVLYLALGHVRGRFDMQPLMDECSVEVGPWRTAAFLEVVRRGLSWALHGNAGPSGSAGDGG
jgi:type 1 glutamine amidotransferase